MRGHRNSRSAGASTKHRTPAPDEEQPLEVVEHEAAADVSSSYVEMVPTDLAADHTEVSPAEFLNRDLSWLQFNRRVLNQALDDRMPLLERLRFLGIFTSNLDEFFMKRVGLVKRDIDAGIVAQTPDGLGPVQRLTAIRQQVLPMLMQQAECYAKVIRPKLCEVGVNLLQWEDLTDSERTRGSQYFIANVFPVLTPLAVDPGSPFPLISNLSMSLGVVLQPPDRGDRVFARVKVPEVLPKWIQVGDQPGVYRFVSLHELIVHHLHDLFPDMQVIGLMAFRVTRNAALAEREEDEGDDIRELVTEELKARRFAKAVRLEHGPKANQWILEYLKDEFRLNDEDVYELPEELDFDDLRPVTDLNLPKLRFDPWTAVNPPQLADPDADIFSVIRHGDLLVHHPYESFHGSVERFVKAAAADPKVLAIKMTVYRTGDQSPFINTLVGAAERGKQVICLVEVKARFDEQRNIELTRRLEAAGAHVLYGVVGLKTHCKVCLIVRDEPAGIRCYVHIGTGNYNSSTARLYTDLGLFTCDPDITRDAVELFHYLTGRSLKRHYRKLLIAPTNMQDQFVGMIEREIEHAKAGRPAGIVAKMNSLEDRKIIRKLYEASKAGVKIDLIVRGFCTLRPGVAGLSENIRVSSIIGRFLEHSRVFHFRNGQPESADGEFYIGSADWMYRNLKARVEAITPIESKTLRRRLWDLLQLMLNDRVQGWDMQSDGSYIQRMPAAGAVTLGTHQALMRAANDEALVTPQEINLLMR